MGKGRQVLQADNLTVTKSNEQYTVLKDETYSSLHKIKIMSYFLCTLVVCYLVTMMLDLVLPTDLPVM